MEKENCRNREVKETKGGISMGSYELAGKELLLIEWSGLKERFLLERGIVLFHDDIESNTFERFVRGFNYVLGLGHPKIIVVLATVGGALDCAFGMYDLIKDCGREVWVVANGYCYSAGTIVLQAGTKRLATPNTTLMIHEAFSLHFGKISEIKEDVRFVERLERRALEILTERSKISVRRLARKIKGKSWWLTAQDALKWGFIDELCKAGFWDLPESGHP